MVEQETVKAVQENLKEETKTEFHQALLDKVKSLVKLSRGRMSEHYDRWDAADDAYKARMCSDQDDEDARKKKEPGKIPLPILYSQIQTYVSYGFAILTQNKYLVELEGTGQEDHVPAKLGEALLDRDFQYNKINHLLYQWLLDIGRFGLCIGKHQWIDVKKEVLKMQPVEGNVIAGETVNGGMEARMVSETVFAGNSIANISPYRFFPDPRVPLTRFQEGEFCAVEDEETRMQLRRMEAQGMYFGTEHIAKGITGDQESTDRRTFFGNSHHSAENLTSRKSTDNNVFVTEIQVDLVAKDFENDVYENPLGDSSKPEKWVITYANDDRIIQAQPLGYIHNKFTYSISQFSPDDQDLINETLTDIVIGMQDVVNFFLNSHVTNVRKHVGNKVVVDPQMIEVGDLTENRNVVRKRPGATGAIDQHFKQFTVSDVTRNHVNDISELIKYIQFTTGINDNLMGQVNSGRRSAREVSAASASAGARLKTSLKLFDEGFIKDMAESMLDNHRQNLTEATFVKVRGDVGINWEEYNGFTSPGGDITVPGVTRNNLVGRYDFRKFDATSPSEKQQQAAILEQTLIEMFKAPEGFQFAVGVLKKDPKKLFDEVLELRGISNPDKFNIEEEPDGQRTVGGQEQPVSRGAQEGASIVTPTTAQQQVV